MMAVDFEADPMEWRPSAIAETEPGELMGLTSDELVGLSPWALRAYAERIGKENAVEMLDYIQVYENRGEATEADNRIFWPLNDAIFGHRATYYKPSLDYSAADLVRWAADRTHLAWHNQIGDDVALADALAAAYSDLAERIGDPLRHLAAASDLLARIALAIVRERRVADDGAPPPAADDGDCRPASADFFEPEPGEHYAHDVVLTCGADIRPEPIEWVWPGYLAAGKLEILSGAPGCGKTTIALALAAILTAGGRWPDGSRAPVGDVGIWSAEDDAADTLAPRLLAAGADMRRVFFVRDTVSAEGERRPFDPATDTAHLARALAGLQVRLLIIDPVVNAVAGDSHKNTETRRALQPLVDLASKLGCAVLGITHFSKGTQGRDPVERVTGSIAFGALARLVFAAAKAGDDDVDADGCDRLFVRSKSNIGPDGGGFRYALELVAVPGHSQLFASRVRWGTALEGEARALLATAEAASDPEEVDAVSFLRDLLSDGPMRAGEVFKDADGCGYSKRAIQRAADKLRVDRRKEGMKGGWVWRLPLPTAPEDATAPPKMPEDAEQKNASPSRLRDDETPF